MQLNELQNKIEQARTLESSLPSLKYGDMKELLEARSSTKKNYLTYVNESGERSEVSYADLYEHALGCARFLQNIGLSRGDRVATISHNHWHTVVQYFACWLLGLVVVPINLEEDDDRIADILENGRIELAFVRTEYRDRFRTILEQYDQLKHIEWIVCEGGLENFIKKEGKLRIDEASFAESDALVVFASDREGQLQGIVLTQQNLLEGTRATVRWHNIDEDSRMMCVLPIHSVNETVVSIITPFFAGGSAVLNQEFKASRLFPQIKEEKIHIVSVLPSMLQSLNHLYAEKDHPDVASLEHIICEGKSLTTKMAIAFEEQFRVPIIYGCGWPETTCYSCFLPLDLRKNERREWLTDYGYPSVGTPVMANEMAVHDEDGNALPEEEGGEIVIRGVNVMERYDNNKEANEKAFRNGWFRSGEEGFYINDNEGRPYFFLTGRLNE